MTATLLDSPALVRFYSHVDMDGPLPERHPEMGPCHLWTASCFESGYGQFKVERKNTRAHRWLWIQKRGSVPADLVLDHWACDRPACVNLDHLRPVTVRENALRAEGSVGNVNLAKTHCPQNHPYSGDNLKLRATDNARICLTCVRKYDRERQRAKRASLAAARRRLTDALTEEMSRL